MALKRRPRTSRRRPWNHAGGDHKKVSGGGHGSDPPIPPRYPLIRSLARARRLRSTSFNFTRRQSTWRLVQLPLQVAGSLRNTRVSSRLSSAVFCCFERCRHGPASSFGIRADALLARTAHFVTERSTLVPDPLDRLVSFLVPRRLRRLDPFRSTVALTRDAAITRGRTTDRAQSRRPISDGRRP